LAVSRQTLIDSRVFLQARQLPLTAALVRPVAQALSQGESLGNHLQNILSALPSAQNPLAAPLPLPVENALHQVAGFLQAHGVKPAAPEVAGQVRDFILSSGLNLESSLSALATGGNQAGATTLQPGQDLKASLLLLQQEVQLALADSDVARSAAFGRLVSMDRENSQALANLTTLQLAAAPIASHDTLALQIPLLVGNQLETAHLSVYWKKGAERQLSDKDPVQMVFVLNTRGLGEVKVALQLYRQSCNCSVTVQDAETRTFFEPYLAELRAGFEANTPFAVNSLDLGLAPESVALSTGSTPAPSLQAQSGGLDVSA
jgi:hypothetical protein